ncbi:Retinoic acid induced 16-like protein-domain-containing protein [Zopfochytrium polystomum]|nr:Retinoic acid induced 16-like protein-domain-containing protein [Zopfochytrium polystomum]
MASSAAASQASAAAIAPSSADPIHFFKSVKANFSRSSAFGSLYSSQSTGGFSKRPRDRANLLSKFQHAWDSIVLDYQTDSNWTKHVRQTDIVKSLDVMGSILWKEHAITDGGVETSGCTELFLNDDMMAQLVRFSENDVPLGFRGEVIRFLNHLVSVLDANILIQNAIHRPTLTLIRWCLADKERKYEDEMLQLEFSISAKIKEFPQLLYIFFSRTFIPKNVSMESAAAGQAVTASPSLSTLKGTINTTGERPSTAVTGEYEFTLFDHILSHLPLEGRGGDFAREACLIILELASPDLADYVSKSEFASMAIAGLAGSYSQLPPRIPRGVAWGETFSASSANNMTASPQAKRTPLDNFRRDMEYFMRLLDFVQAIAIRCPSQLLTSSVLHELKSTFLDNIVQSTVTSASDFDGTTVAHLFYILQMLDAIKEDQFSALFCNFLLGGDDDDQEMDGSSNLDRTKESNDRSGSAGSELRLHIRDILVSKLNSLSEEVVTMTLNVFQSLLSHHSHHALPLLIERLPSSQRGISAASKTLWKSPASAPAAPVLVNPADMMVTTISTDIHDHLTMVSRYFALVPADNPASAVPSHGAYSVSSSSSSVALPESVSLSAYLAEAENVIRSHRNRHPRARAAPPVIMARGSSLNPNPVETYVPPPDDDKDPTSPTAAGVPPTPGTPGAVVFLRSSWQHGKQTVLRASPAAVSGSGVLTAEGAFEGGLLSATSPLREWMLDLSKDATLRKFMVKFANFFSHSYEINLALTGVITQLAAAPIPLLYMYLFSADILLGPTYSSLYSILIRLRREVEERRSTIQNFDTLLLQTRQRMFHESSGMEGSGGASDWLNSMKRDKDLPQQQQQALGGVSGDLDLDGEFMKNVIVLEESVKELLSLLVAHGSYPYDQISYV